jgi:DNA polymerase elongation subunit (family B)
MFSPAVDGKVLTLEDLVQIPNRLAFLNAQKVKECRELMTSKSKVEFLPVHIWESYLPEKNGVLTVEKYAYRMYKIVMFGIVPSGEKVTVVLDNVLPFFEIRIPRNDGDESTQDYNKKFVEKVNKLCSKENYKVKKVEIVSGATIKEYNDTAHFVVLKFSSSNERAKALKYFSDNGFETTHDDPTCYYRMLCRDTLVPWTNWCTLEKYRCIKRHKFFNTLYTLTIDYKDIKPYKGDIFADPYLKNDLTIEANFDIETYDSVVKDDVPQPTSNTAEVFKISLGFCIIDGDLLPPGGDPGDVKYSWAKPQGHLIHYDITTAVTKPMPNRVVVHCRNQSEMLMAFALVWSQMQPDYTPSFNGDTYDWKWIAEKARQLKLLEFLERNMSLANLELYRTLEDKKFVNPNVPFESQGRNRVDAERRTYVRYEWWKTYTFKISAELQNYPGACLNYPGYICIDLMPQLRAANGNPDKYSLHFFLALYGLGDKVDMPYKEMFRMYRDQKELVQKLQPLKDLKWETIDTRARELGLLNEIHASARDMLRVGEYCIVDSLRCHDLMIKTQFIRDKRLLGALSYTTMDDCIYRANGMKVRNMIIAKAQQRNLHVSNRPPKKVEIGKYPGAYVFPPKKGVATAKPSPHEMRMSKDSKYFAWQVMSQEMFCIVLDKISECGAWLEDYLPAIKDGKTENIPQDLMAQFQSRAADKLVTLEVFVRNFGGDLVGEFPSCFIEWLRTDSHYPIAGLDFSSLYPSLIMTYNFSPEMMVHTLERAAECMLQGKKVHPVSFPFNGRTIEGWSIRSRYPEKQTEIDTLLNRLQKISRKDDPDSSEEERLLTQLEELLTVTEYGLFPSVLKMLFDQRVGLKNELKPINHRKEELELLSTEEFALHQAEYTDIMFRFNYLNSKQKALKVFMNTFYGEAGNSLSPLRVLALAGGVTSSGQYNIKKVAALVQELGCRIYYGDTDSVYISMPRDAFKKYDRAYYSQMGLWAYVLVDETWEWLPISEIANREHHSVGPLCKKAYFECLVTESFRQIKKINKAVNDALEADNGTKFLNMAFEEFLYPAAFFSKKKYCGIAHEGTFNPNPKKIFVRGLEYVKKGVSQMLKDLSVDILWKVLSVDNIEPLFKIVEDKIEEIYTKRNLDFEKFVKTASYKPNKDNISVRTFYERMKLLGMAPEPLDRFRYVIVKKYPYKYDLKGCKKELSVGDRMEYADRAKQLDMEIDLDYYMSSGVCGQLARFISYDNRFYVEPRDDSDEAYNEAETKNINACKKHILGCYERWSQKHVSKGPALKSLYKKVNTVFHNEFANILKVSDLWKFDSKSELSKEDKNKSQQSYEENQNMFILIIQKLERQSTQESKSDARRFIEQLNDMNLDGWIQKRKCYQELLSEREDALRKRMPIMQNSMRMKIAQLRKLFQKRDNILESCISTLHSRVGIDKENFDTLEPILKNIEMLGDTEIREKLVDDIKTNVTHNDLLLLNEIDNLYLQMLSMYKIVKMTQIIIEELTQFIHYKLGDSTRTSQANHLDDLDDWMNENLM